MIGNNKVIRDIELFCRKLDKKAKRREDFMLYIDGYNVIAENRDGGEVRGSYFYYIQVQTPGNTYDTLRVSNSYERTIGENCEDMLRGYFEV